jgi:hypothetical protein
MVSTSGNSGINRKRHAIGSMDDRQLHFLKVVYDIDKLLPSAYIDFPLEQLAGCRRFDLSGFFLSDPPTRAK